MPTTNEMRPVARRGNVTIRDVARHIGVTPSTVSRVFNGTGHISEETQQAVRQAMKDLGYEPNLNAQRLAGARDEKTLALLISQLDFHVTLRKVVTLQNVLSGLGYSVPLHAFGGLSGPKANEQVQLAHELRRQRPRAIICQFGLLPPEAQREIRTYQQEGGLVVSFNDPVDLECDQVLFDREDNNYQSARYLLELGHRDIGFWCAETYGNSIYAAARLAGFQRALREWGLSFNPDRVWQNGSSNCNEKAGAEFGRRMVEMADRPTAICLVNDASARAFVAELVEAGIRVPDEMSVVTHDDLPIAQYGGLPLTAVSHPIDETAEAIVELLIARLENHSDSPPRTIILKGELRVRRSTAPPKV